MKGMYQMGQTKTDFNDKTIEYEQLLNDFKALLKKSMNGSCAALKDR